MTKRRKDILKRKYIAPEVYFEPTEPWEMIAASVDGSNVPNEGGGDPTYDPNDPSYVEGSKQNYWFNYNEDEEDY